MGDNAGQAGGRKPERLKLPPTGVLIMLSLVFPGAGQLANGQTAKGWVVIGVSTLLLILFFIQLASVIPPVYHALSAGVEPVIDEAYMDKLYNMLRIVLLAVLVWLYAIVDAVIVGGRKSKEGVKP